MAVYPNNRYMLRSPGRHFGPATGLGVFGRGRSDQMNRFVGGTYAPTASTPDGYGVAGWVPSIKAGSMGGYAFVDVVAAGDILQGGPMAGSATVTITPGDWDLSLTIGMSGTSTIELTTANWNLAGVIGMAGTAAVTLTADGWNLGSIIPFGGSSSFGFSGDANLKGLLSMSGESTPFADLSAQSLARAVWEYEIRSTEPAADMLAGAYDNAGGGGGGLTVPQANQLTSVYNNSVTTTPQIDDIVKVHGLDPLNPLVVTASTRKAGDVDQTIVDSSGTVTVTRL